MDNFTNVRELAQECASELPRKWMEKCILERGICYENPFVSKERQCWLYGNLNYCYKLSGYKVMACDTLQTFGDAYCENELPWGWALFGMFALWLVLTLTVYRNSAYGALFRKHMIVYRLQIVRNLSSDLVSVSLALVLVFVVTSFTSTTKFPPFPIEFPFGLHENRTSFVIELGLDIPSPMRRCLLQTLRPFGGLIVLIIFTQSISKIIVALVHEKETRMKELLHISGLGSIAYYASYVLSFFVQFFPLVVAISLILYYGGVFSTQSIQSLCLFLYSFLFAYIGFSQCIGAFMGSTRIAALVNVGLAFALYLISFQTFKADPSLKMMFCSVPSMCVAYGVDYIFAAGFAFVQIDVNTAQHPNLTECSIMLLLWGTIYAFFGWYLENVVPQNNGLRKRALFFMPTIKSLRGHVCKMSKTLGDLFGICSRIKTAPCHTEQIQWATSIEFENVRKVYQCGAYEHVAVQGLRMSIEDGSIVALLGENGAGKSTTFDMLTGMTEPSDGDIRIRGHSILTDMFLIRKFIGFVPQKNVFYPELTTKQHLDLISSMRTGKLFELDCEETLELLEDLDLEKKLNTQAGQLSGGQKRKLALAMALVGETKVLFLDEVSSGVDPDSRRGLWKILRKYRKGRIIVCTTHFLDEAEFLADKIAILSKGVLIAYDTCANLKSRYGTGYTLMLGTESNDSYVEDIVDLVKREIPRAVQQSSHGGLSFTIPFAQAAECATVIRTVEREPYNCIPRFECPTLEQVFLELVSANTNVSAFPNEHAASMLLARPGKASRFRIFTVMVQKRFWCAMKELPIWAGLFIFSLVLLALPLLAGEVRLGALIKLHDTGKILNHTCRPMDAYNPDRCCHETFGTSNLTTCMKRKGYPQCVMKKAADLKPGCEKWFSFCENVPWMCDTKVCCSMENPKGALNPCFSNVHIDEENRGLSASCPTKQLATTEGFVNSLYQTLTVSLVLSFALSPIISFAVIEKEVNTKFLQEVSGVGPLEYWLGALVWDQLFFTLLALSACSLYSAYPGIGQISAMFHILSTADILAFAFAAIPFTYVLSFQFNDHANAIVFSVVFWLVTGTGLGSIAALLTHLDFVVYGIKSGVLVHYASFALNFLPGYALTTGLTNLHHSFYGHGFAQDSREMIGEAAISILYMSATGVCMWVLLYLRESKRWSNHSPQKKYKPRRSLVGDHADLKAEVRRMQECDKTDMIQIQHLSKGYGQEQCLAIDDVSFGVMQGECFGFLGANGAGKTTTLSILSGETHASSGRVALCGIDVGKHTVEARRHLGYCTQFDNLFPHLTVAQHLTMFAAIHGYKHIRDVVKYNIERMNLEQYRDVQARRLSGGNKRKLSCALILLGAPEVIVLDEPSSGLDPVSQRFLWNVVSNVRTTTGASIILTSHSFVEVQALCDRVAVLVEGKLRCLGSVPYLTSKHGTCFRVKIACNVNMPPGTLPVATQVVLTHLQGRFGSLQVIVLDQREHETTFQIAKQRDISVGDIMENLIEVKKEHLGLFSVTESDLDEVFTGLVEVVKNEQILNLEMQLDQPSGLETPLLPASNI
uniref:ABC transporter domain-containing protein n=1 Tax=Mucochytrium quahogii TaxID=96639 RepID=A0A7S2R6T9_9STRA|mmetsp:Transcript_22712/g.36190  ORF Transcript_22712/g.36190 Transcript_22712/m.36190 type:complete len:1553 (+) Transcript_22712:2514-7172(+)|eukprot:CAMPEP_0203744210 /NCGR_PEP_ID=MMETSP0098-20131031/364_1 /ASSEMBLY_ACC=CAM_ASM_000208 /TAXON_ID=96639 /ORGANISM=" , Strain NY0313808BC1" /LENGTH=1552 /DNA_ID=CAMNT_0050631671 /DNA_START=162 /DNA_END=4820 /DNA_ORIENTATION=-